MIERAQALVGRHLTTGYGGVAALLIAVYIGMVTYHGNASRMVAALGGEFGFVRWAIALIVLWVIIQESGGLGTGIAALAFLALALTAGSKVFPQIATFFKGQ